MKIYQSTQKLGRRSTDNLDTLFLSSSVSCAFGRIIGNDYDNIYRDN
jgi:hypothetical protein